MKNMLLQAVNAECVRLVSLSQRKGPEESILKKFSNIQDLSSHENYVTEVYEELQSRMPLLQEILMSIVFSPQYPVVSPDQKAPLATVYAILLKQRCKLLVGWHKMLSCVLQRYCLDKKTTVILNHLGIGESPTTQIKHLEGFANKAMKDISQALTAHPYVKITCNLGVNNYVNSPGEEEPGERTEVDFLTSSVVLIKDIEGDLSNELPNFPARMPSNTFLPDAATLDGLHSAYAVVVGRFLKKLPGLSWISVPDHISHSRSDVMSEKSNVKLLPMMFCRETKHDYGAKVLTCLQDLLAELYDKSLGNGPHLNRTPVPIGSDQGSKAQLEAARMLKPRKGQKDRLRYLGPIVPDWWHSKKDFVTKAYKTLFHKKSLHDKGTLYYFKSKLGLMFVSGNIDKNYESHRELLVHLGQCLIEEQALEYFGMETESSQPTTNVPNLSNLSEEQRSEASMSALKTFIKHQGYGRLLFKDFTPMDMPKNYRIVHQSNGQTIVVSEEPDSDSGSDEIYDYCTQLTHWALHLMEMEDTAKEGDVDRLVTDVQYTIPFLFSVSPEKSYLKDNVDFLLKVKHTLSPLMRELVLRSSFVNIKGGEGNCCETDLAHKMHVQDQKFMTRHLDVNASDKQVRSSSLAASIMKEVAENTATSVNVNKPRSRATRVMSEEQKSNVKETVRELKPFRKSPGRKCLGLAGIHQYPFKKASRNELFLMLDDVVGAIRQGYPKDDAHESLDQLETVGQGKKVQKKVCVKSVSASNTLGKQPKQMHMETVTSSSASVEGTEQVHMQMVPVEGTEQMHMEMVPVEGTEQMHMEMVPISSAPVEGPEQMHVEMVQTSSDEADESNVGIEQIIQLAAAHAMSGMEMPDALL